MTNSQGQGAWGVRGTTRRAGSSRDRPSPACPPRALPERQPRRFEVLLGLIEAAGAAERRAGMRTWTSRSGCPASARWRGGCDRQAKGWGSLRRCKGGPAICGWPKAGEKTMAAIYVIRDELCGSRWCSFTQRVRSWLGKIRSQGAGRAQGRNARRAHGRARA